MKPYKDKQWLTQQLTELQNKDAVGRLCNVSGDTIEYWRKKHGIPNINYSQIISPSRKHTVNELYFDRIDNEEQAYWLGYIMADGYVGRSTTRSNAINEFGINCQADDVSHIRKLASAIKSTYPIRILHKEDIKRGCCWDAAELKIRSIRFCQSLFTHGIAPKKTGNEYIPELNNDLVIHFIRGFFDGDGSIFKRVRHYGIHIGSMSEKIINQIQQFFEQYGIFWNKYIDFRYSRPFYLLDSNKQSTVLAILKIMYNDASIYLERKHNYAMTIIKEICPSPVN